MKSRETEELSDREVGRKGHTKKGRRRMPKPGWRGGSKAVFYIQRKSFAGWFLAWIASLTFSDGMDMWPSAGNQGR